MELKLKAHEKWLKNNKEGEQLNLSGSSLFGQDFKGSNLSHAILNNCDMSQCDLTKCQLTGASLIGTTLVGAKMSGVDLSGANLTDATCRGAILQQANFSKATLRGCDFFGADLRKVNLEGADYRNANFSKAMLDQNILTKVQEEPQARLDQPSMHHEDEPTRATAGLPGTGGQSRDPNLDLSGRRKGGQSRRKAEEPEDTVLRPNEGGVKVEQPKVKTTKKRKRR